jgi:hypothetical protein
VGSLTVPVIPGSLECTFSQAVQAVGATQSAAPVGEVNVTISSTNNPEGFTAVTDTASTAGLHLFTPSLAAAVTCSAPVLNVGRYHVGLYAC